MKRTDPGPGLPEVAYLLAVHVGWHLDGIHRIISEPPDGPVPTDVLVVAPSAERPFSVLVSSGLSYLPMRARPEAGCDLAWAELAICLTPDWRLDLDSLRDDRWGWPLRLLFELPRYVHGEDRFLWRDHLFSWSDRKPLGPGVPFTGVLFGESRVLPAGFATLHAGGGRDVRILSL